MEKVWHFMLVTLVGVLLLLPGMALSLEIKEKEMDKRQDAERASYILASLYDDPEFIASIGGEMGSRIAFDEEGLASQVRKQFGEELLGFILITERYLRIDHGQGLGPPKFYRSIVDEACISYQREKLVGYARGQEDRYFTCDIERRDDAVYAVEDSMGLARVPMRVGLRIFLSKKVTLPWSLSPKGWKKERECRIFMK